MYDRWYDDAEIGATEVYGGVTVTEAHVVGFAGLTGDHHRLHVDAAFAAKSRYGERIAHGFLVLSLSAGMFPMDPEKVLAFYGMDRVRFLRPTRIGDSLRCRLTVAGVTPKPEGGVVDTDLTMLDQDDAALVVARLRILVARRPAEGPA